MQASPQNRSQEWVEQYADFLYRFSLARVRNATVAEDLVQETFVAALQSLHSFQSQSSEKTWLTGILKHKIVDYYRAKARKNMDLRIEEDGLLEDAFTQTRHLKVPPANWKTAPENAAENSELRNILENCLNRMNERLRDIFLLRELDGQDTETLCKDFGLSPTNLWVILHRARFQLKNCLEKNGLK